MISKSQDRMKKFRTFDPHILRILFALLFMMYIGGVLVLTPRIGVTAFALSALPVLYVAIHSGLRRALAFYAFCFLLCDTLLLFILRPGLKDAVVLSLARILWMG